VVPNIHKILYKQPY